PPAPCSAGARAVRYLLIVKTRTLASLLLLALTLCLSASPAARAARRSAADPATGAAEPAGGAEPVLWPEPQRAFFQDGPQLLPGAAQRAALVRMAPAERRRWTDAFLASPPGGAPAAALKEGIALRQRLAANEFVSPADVRAQLLFLNGPPARRAILDC